jgi:hypothetical protein
VAVNLGNFRLCRGVAGLDWTTGLLSSLCTVRQVPISASGHHRQQPKWQQFAAIASTLAQVRCISAGSSCATPDLIRRDSRRGCQRSIKSLNRRRSRRASVRLCLPHFFSGLKATDGAPVGCHRSLSREGGEMLIRSVLGLGEDPPFSISRPAGGESLQQISQEVSQEVAQAMSYYWARRGISALVGAQPADMKKVVLLI